MASCVTSYWTILSIPSQDKLDFCSLLYFAEAASMEEISEYDALSEDFIKNVSVILLCMGERVRKKLHFMHERKSEDS